MGGFFFLSSFPRDPKHPANPPPPLNGAVHIVCKTLRNVMSSATEAETGGLFYNGQEALPITRALEELGHKQPPTPIQTDNSTAYGIVTSSIRQRRSKSMDMRFYWIQDRCANNDFLVYWKPGRTNLGDYFTKHHPTSHHQQMRPIYLHQATHIFTQTGWQGCILPEVWFPNLTYINIDQQQPESKNHSLIS